MKDQNKTIVLNMAMDNLIDTANYIDIWSETFHDEILAILDLSCTNKKYKPYFINSIADFLNNNKPSDYEIYTHGFNQIVNWLETVGYVLRELKNYGIPSEYFEKLEDNFTYESSRLLNSEVLTNDQIEKVKKLQN